MQPLAPRPPLDKKQAEGGCSHGKYWRVKPWCLLPRASVSGRVMDKAKQCHIIVELTCREENGFPD